MKQWLFAGMFVCAAQAGAQPVANAQWNADMAAGRYAQVERADTAKINANPDDIDAHAALVRSALALNDGLKRDAALKVMDACVARVPRSAVCHYGVGSLLGAQAISKDVVKAAMGMSKSREASKPSLELDTPMFAERSALTKFYLLAPGLAGGKVSKAGALAQTAAALHPYHADILMAIYLLHEGQLDDAELQLNALKSGVDVELNEEAGQQCARLAFERLKKKSPANAQATFEGFIAERHQLARSHYGLGHIYGETADWDPAVAPFTAVSSLQGVADLTNDYRLGTAQQAKGSRESRRVAFARFVAVGKDNPKHLEDAQKRVVKSC